jgi:hypothetical protein
MDFTGMDGDRMFGAAEKPLPPHAQADLHELGVLPDPDFKRDASGMVVRCRDKVQRYMDENNGELPF